MYDFKNKTVLISGISSGIGREFAKQLIFSYNCSVYGISRNEEKILNFKKSLGEKSDNFKDYFLFDVSIEKNWEDLAKTLNERGVKIDVLINCAGFLPEFKKFDLYSTEEFKRIFDVDFFSCVYSVKHLLPIIENGSSPAVINVSSSSALMTFAGISGYSGAKSALKSFTLALSEEYRGKIFFSCVCPGFTNTNLFGSVTSDEKELKFAKKISSSCEKIVGKTVRRIRRKRRLVVVGYDAKLMGFCYKFAPILTARLTTKILKKSKLKMFEKI